MTPLKLLTCHLVTLLFACQKIRCFITGTDENGENEGLGFGFMQCIGKLHSTGSRFPLTRQAQTA